MDSSICEFAEQILFDRIFIGNFQEKRYVQKLNAYRDVIVLDKQEKKLCDDLITIKNHCVNADYWLSFTEPHDIDAPPAYCIWTDLDAAEHGRDVNVATTVFGEYWFQIKSIQFTSTGMELKLKILRSIETIASMSTSSAIGMAQQAIADIDTTRIQQYVQQNIIEVDWIALFNQWRTTTNQFTYRFLASEVNANNIAYCLRMTGGFIISCVLALVYFVKYMGEFTLKLISEMTKFFHAITPITLSVLNLIGKIFGGFYLLIAMVWRDSFGTAKRNTTPIKGNYSFQSRPAISYRDNSRQNANYRRTPR